MHEKNGAAVKNLSIGKSSVIDDQMTHRNCKQGKKQNLKC